jgi:hypothetical protein
MKRVLYAEIEALNINAWVTSLGVPEDSVSIVEFLLTGHYKSERLEVSWEPSEAVEIYLLALWSAGFGGHHHSKSVAKAAVKKHIFGSDFLL